MLALIVKFYSCTSIFTRIYGSISRKIVSANAINQYGQIIDKSNAIFIVFQRGKQGLVVWLLFISKHGFCPKIVV